MKGIPFIFFLLFFYTTASLAQTNTIVYGSNPQAGHYANINGIELYYETYGSGEPLLKIFQLIPGASLCIFPDSNHGVCQQHPKLFNETVLTFLTK